METTVPDRQSTGQRATQNPQPPDDYSCPVETDVITGESLLHAVREALKIESSNIDSATEEDTPLEQRLAAVWDASSTSADTGNNDDTDTDNDDDTNTVFISIEQQPRMAVNYRPRTVELALGALANLASWPDPAHLLLADPQVCDVSARLLAQGQDAPLLTEACRLYSSLLAHLLTDGDSDHADIDADTDSSSNNNNQQFIALYQFVISGWSIVVRLVDILHYTQHMPLRLAALDTLRWCILVEPGSAADIPLDDLADWFAEWLEATDSALNVYQ
ncbi:hypothetical protein BDF19DRAFT_439579 [Syncephalis fuscata]|nr:hypothetical protein BDF19DRAFT_439579 [Syncephalis fuscata]